MTRTETTATIVLGRYRLGPLLGTGGSGRVYRSLDLATGAEVAVKAIPVDSEMAKRAGAEVRAAARLSHPGLVRLLDWGEDRNGLYLVSELVEGEPLSRRLRSGPMPDRALAVVVADVLDALAHAHGRGVVHRDVKPANVLVDGEGRGHLADFGVARLSGETGVTATGGLVGTVSYMSPEQAAGRPVGPATDVYSAILVLYEGLAGGNPLVAATPGETMRRAAAGEVPALGSQRPNLPAPLVRAVGAALARDPATRPAPADLAALLRRETESIPRRSSQRRLPLALPRISSAVGGAALVAAALTQATQLRPAPVVAASAAGAAAFALAPFVAALACWVATSAALARVAPGTAALLGPLGLGALLLVRHRPRLALLPVAAPVLVVLGLGPLYVVAAGLVRGSGWRLWAALTGLVAAASWQLARGTDGLLLSGARAGPVGPDLHGVVSPVEVVHRLAGPLREARPALAGGLVLVAATLAVPFLARPRAGLPRLLAVLVWSGALLALVAALGDGLEPALGPVLPSCIVLCAWAARPWRLLVRRAEGRPTATLRGPRLGPDPGPAR